MIPIVHTCSIREAHDSTLVTNFWLTRQGFDEFMNLVIDDAVEVKQVTKTNPEEKRRQLGRTLADSILALWPPW